MINTEHWEIERWNVEPWNFRVILRSADDVRLILQEVGASIFVLQWNHQDKSNNLLEY